MKKLTFEIRSPAHQQNAIHAVQQILPDPTKPIVVTIQERNRSLDQNRKLWACLGDVSRQVVNRPGFPGECFVCELRLPDHCFRWKHNKLFLLLPGEYGPAFPAIVDCYTSPPT